MTATTNDGQSEAGRKRHALLMEGEVELVGPRREMAKIRDHIIYSDESKQIGGEGTAPSPLQYFVSAILF